jgi:hypothetical protein
MALNRKICKNLAHHSCGVGNAIRRRVRHQYRGGVSSVDPRTRELRVRMSLVIAGLSFVISRATSNGKRPAANDEGRRTKDEGRTTDDERRMTNDNGVCLTPTLV